ncbi:MAG TPA: hypothetical protein VMB71_07690 [Acetobacteraceae bacterium]|nr:hypothetical protein [Acetobacteraceae bacterium]
MPALETGAFFDAADMHLDFAEALVSLDVHLQEAIARHLTDRNGPRDDTLRQSHTR